MSIESSEDLRGMQAAGKVVATAIEAMRAAVRLGMTTAQLDKVAANVFKKFGARSAPQMAYNFPGVTCISVNDEVVHGVPGSRKLAPGDVLKVDVTAELGGYIADAATTILLPPVSPVAARLKQSAVDALGMGLGAARAGRRVSMIGRAIHAQVKSDGFSVVRELCGHGVGRRLHEPPDVSNYEDPFCTDWLTEGLVIAVEPMLLASASRVVAAEDGWTIRAKNGALAVHEEHTIVIREGAPLILTAA